MAKLISSGLTEGTYVELTTQLLTLDCVTLPVGLRVNYTTSSLQAASLLT
jgi:hypothetical protein